MDELRSINIVDGVNTDGDGFLTISVTTAQGALIVGQVSPAEARQMALQWLEAAEEAAEQDAAVVRTIRKLELPIELAAVIAGVLRDGRQG